MDFDPDQTSLLERIDRLLPRSLQLKLSLLVTGLLVLLISLVGALFSDFLRHSLLEEIGAKALDVAHAVSYDPEVLEGLLTQDSARTQAVAEKIRQATGAQYVVIGDSRGIRYSHPDPSRIGHPFVGGDLGPALQEGRAYVSRAVGTLGESLRGIVPLRGENQDVIGFVAVGYLLRDIDVTVRAQQRQIYGYIAIVLMFGVFGAAIIARGLKSAIFGLEPHEIAALYQERSAIIGTIREGVVAVDGAGQLTLVNQAARRYLGQEGNDNLRGRQLAEVCTNSELEQMLTGGQSVLDREMRLKGRTMIVNVVPFSGPPRGAVASFRPKDELDRLGRELSQMQEYSELLRSQSHEYSNKLHTIAGLLQIGAQQEALDLIMTEASGYEELIRTLTKAVPDPVVAGLIIGKFNRARELKVLLSLDPDSSLADVPAPIDRQHLVTILGNLLDNAFEAVRAGDRSPEVRLILTDLGDDLILEVEDSGPGVSPEVAETLFDKGVTTKGQAGRGYGLYLLRQAVTALGGNITYGQGELGGALFTVSIPKTGREEA
ncbi:sensor histidine kinase [Desulfuromonas sp. KJ2020]|uniref:ATP-binding protein n=1 Tax=Desulfuromonas sp. KJ2020 TaxID=2919173 RepID=UPI0020A7ACB9|nr:sensor histidine kinase [Desulfuromonas sp. KJ2020]MCP3177723.1 sensor histidine kinase [Desulfuromonas sp. KJ2020]